MSSFSIEAGESINFSKQPAFKTFQRSLIDPRFRRFTKQNFLLRHPEAGQGETSIPQRNSFSTYIRGTNATPCPAMTAAMAISCRSYRTP